MSRTTTITGFYTEDYSLQVSTTLTLVITEILCNAIAPKSTLVAFANTEQPTKFFDFLGLNVLDATYCLTPTDHVFSMPGLLGPPTILPDTVAYPWLTIPTLNGNRLQINVADVDNIDFGGRYTDMVHSQGKGTELFDLVVCAMVPPLNWYTQG